MKKIIVILGSSILVACASGAGSNNSGDVDKTQAIVLDCPNGLANCVSAANRICGSRGFNEIDRFQDVNLTNAGRVEDQHDGRLIYREDVRFESQQETLVIRCKNL